MPTPSARQSQIFKSKETSIISHRSKISRNKRSEACVSTTTNQINSTSSDHSSDLDHDTYTFMAISRKFHALSVNLDKQAWFADSGATEHMTEHREWFSTFKPIPSGTWSVTVADDRDLWVRGIGDIRLTRTIDGVQKNGILHKVMFIPDLRRNLFSIGLTSKAGLSFQTFGSTCALYRDLGKGPKVMEGT